VNSGRAPALLVSVELEAGARVAFDAENADDFARLLDWLHAHPLRDALFALAWALRVDAAGVGEELRRAVDNALRHVEDV
jgi:hypothetical protein